MGFLLDAATSPMFILKNADCSIFFLSEPHPFPSVEEIKDKLMTPNPFSFTFVSWRRVERRGWGVLKMLDLDNVPLFYCVVQDIISQHHVLSHPASFQSVH